MQAASPKDSVAILQKMTGILSSVATAFGVMLDPTEVFWFTQNKLFEIQGRSNSLQLFKIRSQSTARNYCQPYLEHGLHMVLCRYGVNREFGWLWFSTTVSQS